MKKLKLTIAGEVMTFNLPENGEYKCEVEKLYVPKVGDCVTVECRVTNDIYFYWFNNSLKMFKNYYHFSFLILNYLNH